MKQTVSIVIPVYNEVSRLFDGLREIIKYIKKDRQVQYEILLVDDGSDTPIHTLLLSSSLKKDVELLIQSKQLRLLRIPRNIGKGGALKEGILRANGAYIVFTDIDCSVPMSYLPLLVQTLNSYDVAIGSRRLPDSHIIVHQPLLRETAGRIYTSLVNILLGVKVHDVTCGFKGFKKQAAYRLFSQLQVRRWSFDAEVLYRARGLQMKIKEVPVAWSNKVGSRVKLRDTLSSFIDLLSIRFNSSALQQLTKTNVSSVAFVCDHCDQKTFTFLFDHHQNWKVQRCTVCGLTQVIPRPTTKEVAALYANDEDHFEPYVDQLPVHQQYFREKLKQIFFIIQNSKSTIQRLSLLDIGCLTGVLLEEAQRLGVKVVGVDISKDAVAYCKNRGIEAFHGTAVEYAKKYPSKKFDIVTAFEIIEHEYSPKMLVETISTLLKPQGIVAISTPNHGSIWRKLMGKYWPGYTHKEHLYFFDPQSLRNTLEQAGFEVVLLHTNDARPFPLSFMFTRGADYLPVGKKMFKVIGKLLEPIPLKNPFNPWDDLLILGRKK